VGSNHAVGVPKILLPSGPRALEWPFDWSAMWQVRPWAIYVGATSVIRYPFRPWTSAMRYLFRPWASAIVRHMTPGYPARHASFDDAQAPVGHAQRRPWTDPRHVSFLAHGGLSGAPLGGLVTRLMAWNVHACSGIILGAWGCGPLERVVLPLRPSGLRPLKGGWLSAIEATSISVIIGVIRIDPNILTSF